MASYTLTVVDKTVTFEVTEVTSGDRVRFFIRYADDESSQVYNSENNLVSGSATSITRTVTLSPGDYLANVKINNDDWLGAQGFSIEGSSRPDDWNWSDYSIYSGCPYENLNASVWSAFQQRINDFREYVGWNPYNFTRPISDSTLLITLFTEAENVISEFYRPNRYPFESRTLSMTYLNSLAQGLNSVP